MRDRLRRLGARLFPLWVPRATAARRRRSWIGHLFRLFGGRYVVGSAVIGALLYTCGLGVAALRPGFAHEYVHSHIWALAVVTAWVLAWGEWSDRALYDLPRRIQPALRTPLTDDEIDAWHRRFYDAPRDLGVGAVLAVVAVWLTLDHPEFWAKRFENWSTYPHAGKAIMSVYFIVGMLLTSTMLYGFWNYIRFANDVLRRKLNADLVVARTALQHLTSFGLATGVGWTVAIVLAADVFARSPTTLSIGFLTFLALFGFALIIVPQFLAHDALLWTRDEVLNATTRAFDVRAPAQWLSRYLVGPEDGGARARQFLKEVGDTRVWIYTPPQALVFLLQITTALASIFVHRR